MYLPDIELHECRTLEEASSTMRALAPHARFLAGGTDLLVDLKTGRVATRHLVSLKRVAALRGVSAQDHGLRLGAMTSITELNRSELLRGRFASLLDASLRLAAPPIRNLATVGGNVMSAVPCADLPPILMAMSALAEVWSDAGFRGIPLESFFAGPRKTHLRPGEILAAITVPAPTSGFGAAYERFGLRDGNAIPVASVAASLQLDGGDRIRDARIVLGAVAPIPKLASEAAQCLLGRRANEDAFGEAARRAQAASRPISDVRGSESFRRELVEVLTRRALAQAYRRARGNTA